ncbi:TPA: hypothetical protein RQO42_004545 [Klebsiella michiganensis]|uniref:hypothetical protein n=1 Tax=Klebsiella michiganensis TaxID=1134687 RepID=UPI00191F317F|nr:hypothetical protein [Klebsiella michiganensis]MBL0791040.1 hypothetical protein [Klebsiella michiganensis]MBX8651817.1 hypothetical protein [Klebsiella michiganensis]MDU6587011.1 hypothetical protein [Klebsiella michiganensis]HCT3873894.1 hypothetical protein [Klebsiella michiganensis]HDX8785166.1 hypothetical protein [Klebsiella michiganensis]
MIAVGTLVLAAHQNIKGAEIHVVTLPSSRQKVFRHRMVVAVVFTGRLAIKLTILRQQIEMIFVSLAPVTFH